MSSLQLYKFTVKVKQMLLCITLLTDKQQQIIHRRQKTYTHDRLDKQNTQQRLYPNIYAENNDSIKILVFCHQSCKRIMKEKKPY